MGNTLVQLQFNSLWNAHYAWDTEADTQMCESW